MAFFMESTFVGLFFLGWDKLSKRQHLAVTFCTALGTNLSALWILVANGWMQNPVGSEFSYQTMRMEMTSFFEVVLNPVAQVKFIHTVAAGYTTASMFVLGISSWYILKGRDLAFAKRSFSVAAGFGLASVLSVIVLGDESGYEIGDVQKTKLAVMEAEWETQEAPAAFTAFGMPDSETMTTDYEIKIPYVLGLIATRSIDEQVTGIDDLIDHSEERIRGGMVAYDYLQKLRSGDVTEENIELFEAHKADLGYGLLLKRYVENPADATHEQIKQAARDTIPPVAPMFWSFRIMVACGFWMLFVFAAAFWYNAKRQIEEKRWLLKVALYSMPVPWIACEMGWFVAEFGRQPWAIGEVLPTFLATSSLTVNDLIFSITGFVLFYTFLLIIMVYLMVKFAKTGPSSLHTGRYHHETGNEGAAS
jgi:cytochrome d ubiquinol oxidase subunit I